ncbi:hypothetical protein J1614_006767 [Plenodomus biglobosus]|nr:hypothetical protein J1614_006767 [Plenodomus biglobosus]
MAYEVMRPVDGGITTIVISSIMIPLTILFVVLRIWARLMLRKRLELNDYSIILGAVRCGFHRQIASALTYYKQTFAVANAALTIPAVIYGGIGHQPSEVVHVTPTLMKFTTALSLTCNFAHTIIKFSIVHLYLVIFSCSRIFVVSSHFVIFVIFAYCIANVVVELLTCKSTGWDWHQQVDEKACSRQKVQYLSGAIFNMVVDIVILTLPLTQIWGLHISKRKKRGLVTVFGLGFLICIISALRVEAIMQVSYNNLAYSLVPLSVYSVVEPCLAAINACLPLLQPLRTKLAEWRASKAMLVNNEIRGLDLEESPHETTPIALHTVHRNVASFWVFQRSC